MFSFLAEIYPRVLCMKNIDNHYECLSFRNWWFGGKKRKKRRKVIRAKQNRINRIRLIKHSKIPNYKISSSRLYWISTWSRNLYNFDRLAKVFRLTLEIWREVNSCEFRVINLKVDFRNFRKSPRFSKRMKRLKKERFYLDKRISDKPLWIDQSISLLEIIKKFPNTRNQKEKKRKKEKHRNSIQQ